MTARAALVVVVAVALASGACRRSAVPTTSSSPSAVDRVVAPAHTAVAARAFLGIVVAPETVDVSASVDGRLNEVLVRAGDRVAKDDVLARIDVRAAQKDLAMARAALLSSESERDRAQLDLDQATERLARRSGTVEISSGTVSTTSREEQSASSYQRKLASVHLQAAVAAIAEKQAQVDKLALLVAEGVVRAPFAGRVTARYLDNGAALPRGTPIVRLIEDGTLRVRFAMPEDDATLAPDDPVRISLGTAALAGVVEKVVPEIDTAARMIFAEARFVGTTRDLALVHSGQVAHVAPDPTALSKRSGNDSVGQP
jgi:RND family efflux transporter MFP subunit